MNDDDLTTDLGRELRVRSDAMHGSSLGLADVQRRARSIRRRRTATAVGGAVAAIAVIVPTAALANHHGHPTEPLPATQNVSPSPTELVNPDAVLDVSRLSRGAAPALGYVADGTYHGPGGETLDVGTDAPVDRMAVLVGGTIVFQTRDDSGRTAIQVYSPTAPGTKLSTPMHAGEGFAVNADRNLTAWMTPHGRVEGYGVGATRLGIFRMVGKVPGDSPQVVALAGDDCTGDGSCRVLVRTSDPTTGANRYWQVAQSGITETATPATGLRTVSDLTHGGDLVGLTKIRQDGSTCSGIHPADGSISLRTCDRQLFSFSPDAGTVSALADQFDGPGSSLLAAYDVSGHRLFDHASDPAKPAQQATVQTVAWEDETHLLATVYQHGEWSVVRFGLDGSMEVAVPGVSADIARSPIILPGEHS